MRGASDARGSMLLCTERCSLWGAWTDESPPRLAPQGYLRSTLSNGPAPGLFGECRCVPCMDGAPVQEESDVSANGQVRSCIRPVVAAALAAGHDVISQSEARAR